jgi:hypothetical protein
MPEAYPPLDTLSHHSRSLIDGERWDQYGSTYKVLPAVLGGLHRARWTEQQALALCLDRRHALGERLAAKWKGSVGSQVRSKWRATVRRHGAHDQLMAHWCNELVSCWPLDGRHGATLRVALALAVCAHEAGSLTFTASRRRIGEIAGVGYASDFARHSDTKTVRKALNRLESLGVFETLIRDSEVSDERLFHARTEFTLVEPQRLHSLLTSLSTQDPPKHPSGAFRWISGVDSAQQTWLHPVFEHSGLGMAACRVWHLLGASSRQMAAREIALTLRISLSGVHEALRALEEARLVDRGTERNWHRLARDLDDVAEELGVSCRPENRRRANQAHRRDRKAALLARRSTRTSADEVLTAPPAPSDDFPTPTIDPFTGEIHRSQVASEPTKAELAAITFAVAAMLGAPENEPPESLHRALFSALSDDDGPFGDRGRHFVITESAGVAA